MFEGCLGKPCGDIEVPPAPRRTNKCQHEGVPTRDNLATWNSCEKLPLVG